MVNHRTVLNYEKSNLKWEPIRTTKSFDVSWHIDSLSEEHEVFKRKYS